MFKKLLLGLILINVGFYQLLAQEIVKTDSIDFIRVGKLDLRFTILDSACINKLVAPKYPLGGEHLSRLLCSGSYPMSDDSMDLFEGPVNIGFTIDKNGFVKDILIDNQIKNIKNSSLEFIQKDLTAILKKLFKFEPAKCNGIPVRIRLNYTMTYSYK